MRTLTHTLLVIGLLIPASFAKNSKIGKDLDTAKEDTVDVIVQYKVQPTGAHQDKVARKGGKSKLRLNAARADVYSIKASELDDLANDPDVSYISPDRVVQATDVYTNEASNAATAQSYGFDGTGIGVAVIDSGVSLPPDLVKRVVYSESFVSPKSDEVYGHGTHVAGFTAGNREDSSKKYIGVAPGADIIALRVLDDNGKGADSNVIAAIDRAIALRTKYNIRVINLSLGRAVK